MVHDVLMEEQLQENALEKLINIKMQYYHPTYLSGSICFLKHTDSEFKILLLPLIFNKMQKENIIRKNIIPLLFALIPCFIISCMNNNQINENTKPFAFETVRVKEIPFNSSWTVSDAFKEVKFIKLETTTNSVFGHIDRIILTKDYIMILDWLVAKDIFIFSRSGSFINSFKNIGKGPGEFLDPTDFFWDEADQSIVVLDNGKFLHYYKMAANQPDFIKTIEIPENIFPFEATQVKPGNKLAFICGSRNPNLCITDSNGLNSKYVSPYVNRNFSIELRNGLNDNNGNLLYRKYANDTIYRISGTGVEPFKFIDFHQDKSFSDLLQLPENEQLRVLNERSLINLYFECDSIFYLKYSINGKEFYLFCDNFMRLFHVSKINLKNDLYGSENLLCKGIDPITKSFVFSASPMKIISMLNEKSPLINAKYQHILQAMTLNETDNTILVLAK